MRCLLKRTVSWTAIFAVVVHAILVGLSPVTAAPIDPFSVICHSGGQADAEQTPSLPGTIPGKTCDHCTLCNANVDSAPPDVLASPAIALTKMQVARPESDAASAANTSNLHLARGPPSVV